MSRPTPPPRLRTSRRSASSSTWAPLAAARRASRLRSTSSLLLNHMRSSATTLSMAGSRWGAVGSAAGADEKVLRATRGTAAWPLTGTATPGRPRDAGERQPREATSPFSRAAKRCAPRAPVSTRTCGPWPHTVRPKPLRMAPIENFLNAGSLAAHACAAAADALGCLCAAPRGLPLRRAPLFSQLVARCASDAMHVLQLNPRAPPATAPADSPAAGPPSTSRLSARG